MEVSAAISNSCVSLSKLLIPRVSHRPVAAVRTDPYRCASVPRALVRRTRMSRRKPVDADGAGGEGDDLLSGDGDDGPFGGGGGGGGGGKGWNFGGDGGANWEENSNSWFSSSDPAFDFVYDAILWFALSNCTHFAVKKVARILQERAKVVEPIRVVPSMC